MTHTGSGFNPERHHVMSGDKGRWMHNLLLPVEIEDPEAMSFDPLIPRNGQAPPAGLLIREGEGNKQGTEISHPVDQLFQRGLFRLR